MGCPKICSGDKKTQVLSFLVVYMWEASSAGQVLEIRSSHKYFRASPKFVRKCDRVHSAEFVRGNIPAPSQMPAVPFYFSEREAPPEFDDLKRN